jgi:hypothetical protein
MCSAEADTRVARRTPRVWSGRSLTARAPSRCSTGPAGGWSPPAGQTGVAGRHVVRDLWRHRDLGTFADSFTATVPAHGAVLVKVGTRPRS